jgi:FKBP12-rapamycin complex-associated protein
MTSTPTRALIESDRVGQAPRRSERYEADVHRLLSNFYAFGAGKGAAAATLRDYVQVEAQEVRVEETQTLLTELYHRIASMVRSPEAHERAGGVSAIDALLDVNFEEAEEGSAKLARYATYLRTALQHPANDDGSVRATSAAMGHLARVGGELAAEAVDAEARRALEMLKPDPAARERTELRVVIGFEPRRSDAAEMRHELRLLSAVCVLRELADAAPALMYTHLATGFERIWLPLTDSSQPTRAAAGAALSSFLGLVTPRPSHHTHEWYTSLLAKARRILSGNGEPAALHGALLAMQARRPPSHGLPGAHSRRAPYALPRVAGAARPRRGRLPSDRLRRRRHRCRVAPPARKNPQSPGARAPDLRNRRL